MSFGEVEVQTYRRGVMGSLHCIQPPRKARDMDVDLSSQRCDNYSGGVSSFRDTPA